MYCNGLELNSKETSGILGSVQDGSETRDKCCPALRPSKMHHFKHRTKLNPTGKSGNSAHSSSDVVYILPENKKCFVACIQPHDRFQVLNKPLWPPALRVYSGLRTFFFLSFCWHWDELSWLRSSLFWSCIRSLTGTIQEVLRTVNPISRCLPLPASTARWVRIVAGGRQEGPSPHSHLPHATTNGSRTLLPSPSLTPVELKVGSGRWGGPHLGGSKWINRSRR